MASTCRRLSILVIGTSLVVAGCSHPYSARNEITGTVKLGGELLKDGIISFEPLENQETRSGSNIVNGDYKIPQIQGLMPGKYLVRIESGDGMTPANPEDIAGPSTTNIVSKDRIPPDWGAKTKQEVTVIKGGPNKFDYDIPLK